MRFLFLFISTYIFAYTLNVEITNIKNNNGNIYLIVYKNPNNFLHKEKAYKKIILKADKNLSYQFILPKGVYAITTFHDENSNQVLDKNFFHFPVEGYGFSTNPFLFGKPTFGDAEFVLKSNKTIQIKMKY